MSSVLVRRFATTPRRCHRGAKGLQTESIVEPSPSSCKNQITPKEKPEISRIDLPPLSEWRSHFSPMKMPAVITDRVSIRNPQTAAAIADSFVPEGSKNKTIIEAYPGYTPRSKGPGALTRALLQLPRDRIRKLIVMENHEPYLEYLRPLEAIDPRIKVMSMRGFDWDTYQVIEDLGLLDDVPRGLWADDVHPHLHFISHLPQSILGEQLVAQLFRTIPDQFWLFRYGRVPLSIVMSDWVWKRISASKDDLTRCKLSVIAQAVSSVKLSLPSHVLQPYNNHFHPTTVKAINQANRRGGLWQAVHIVPHREQVISKGMLDKWDYCLRRLFVLKSKSLKSALSHLAPGSEVLLKTITDRDLPASERVNVKTEVRKLEIREWANLVKAFDEWPFAPEDLSISFSFTDDQRMSF